MAKIDGWSISEFYKKAWEIVKTHKVLWLFGIASAAGSSFNFRSSRNIDPETISKFFQGNQNKDSVLGDSTSVLFENLSYLFSSIPMWAYWLIGTELVLLGLGAIILGVVFQNWSTAALLRGIQAAMHKQKVTIRTTSEHAFPNIIPLIKATLIPYVLFSVAAIIIFIALIVGMSVSGGGLQGLFVLLIVIWVVAFLIALLLLTLTLIWAVRAVVLDRKGPMEALREGYSMVKANFWRMFGLGIVNSLTSILVVAVPIAVIAALGFAAYFTIGRDQFLGVKLLVFAGILILAFVVLMQILGGIITAFKATVWSLAYQLVKKHHD